MALKCHRKLSFHKDGSIRKSHPQFSKRKNLEECLGEIKIVMLDGEPDDTETCWIQQCNNCGNWYQISEGEITRNLQALVDDNRWHYE